RARVKLQKGDNAGASTDAAAVPAGFEFNLRYTDDLANRGRLSNDLYFFSFDRGSISVAPWYRQGDPRVTYRVQGGSPAPTANPQDAVPGGFHQQTKFFAYNAPIRLASKLEADYIAAEASNNVTTQLTLINARRAVNGRPAYAGAQDAASVKAELFNQRALEFYLEGKRVADFRRSPASVAGTITPAGAPYFKPGYGNTGTDTCYPIPRAERDNNPNMTGANGSAQIRNWTYLSAQQRFSWNRLFLQAFLNSSDAGNETATDDRGTYLLRSGQPIVDQSRVMAAQLQHGFDVGKKQTFTYGLDYIFTNPRTGNTINGGNENIDNVTEYGAYLQSSTKPVKQLELLLAARGDGNNVIEGKFFSPRAALIIKPTETQNIRFTYNRAFSTPANFAFFLDLVQARNIGGSGFDVIARGNPPKNGWQYNRSCGTTSAYSGFCMKSAFANQGNFVGASAASAFPGAVQALSGRLVPGIAQALSANFPAAVAQQLAAGAVQFLGSRTPTNADLATRVSYLTSATVPVDAAKLTDIAPLAAAFNNTFEVGYKAIINDRVRLDASLWSQERGDIGTSAALATPNVFFGNPQQLGGYLGQQLGAYFAQALAGVVPAAQIPATAAALAAGVASAVTPSVAALPLGVVTFANGSSAPNAVYATYLPAASGSSSIWVKGLDLAADVVATDRLTFDFTYSWQNKTVFDGINGGNNLPLMSNSPGSRGAIGARYSNPSNGFGFDVRTRYNQSYLVNSGVYATGFAFPIAAGQAGATPSTAGGAGRCSPAPAGTFCYEDVPEAFLIDAQITKRFTLGNQKLMWSLNGQNMLNNKVRTFPGAPEIGRMIMTRIQYSF
ncbi:MAG: RagB/SusD family nutrient uptake outer membrane protein, partial [Gemmatimonadaceae bacterium]|nr:RagB/SusD family nutrient uptake outer membrane protein [Gemmatimonadaceae bacterium]